MYIDDRQYALVYMVPLNDHIPYGKQIPQIHGYYDTWQEAQAMRAKKFNPEAYTVCSMRNNTGKGY